MSDVEHLPAQTGESLPAAATPAQLVQIAVQSGADVEKIEKLLDLQLRWEANEARKAFVEAMTRFRAKAPTITKNKPGHNSKYASIDKVTEIVNPLLSESDLSFAWETEQRDGLITVHCEVTHIQGHTQRTTLTGAPDSTGSKNDIQAIGSTVSYLQRYTLLSALGLATGEEDTDGHPPQPKQPTADAGLLADLNAKAEEGWPALQAAWKELTEAQRKSVGSAFGPLKKKAEGR